MKDAVSPLFPSTRYWSLQTKPLRSSTHAWKEKDSTFLKLSKHPTRDIISIEAARSRSFNLLFRQYWVVLRDSASQAIPSFFPSFIHYFQLVSSPSFFMAAAGLLTIKMTESPRKNSLLTYRSLLTAAPRVRPLPPLEFSVHISLTSSSNLSSNENAKNI